MEINNYNKINNINQTISSMDSLNKKDESSLGMDDFLQLLVAQMTNQDSMNPMDNTEFVSQLAQFSTLQAMTDLRDVSYKGQAMELVDKNVVMATYNNKGELEIEEGIVEKVTIFGKDILIYVNGKEYGYENLMEIKANIKEEVEEKEILEDILESLEEIQEIKTLESSEEIEIG